MENLPVGTAKEPYLTVTWMDMKIEYDMAGPNPYPQDSFQYQMWNQIDDNMWKIMNKMIGREVPTYA